jgi:hypothetical protein
MNEHINDMWSLAATTPMSMSMTCRVLPTVALEESTQGLQPFGGRRRKAVLSGALSDDDAVDGGGRLVAAVGSPKLLDSLVSRPGQLQSEMAPPPLVGNPGKQISSRNSS